MLRKNLILLLSSLLIFAIGAETFLRRLEHTKFGAGKFNLLRAATYEHFYFFSGIGELRSSYGHGPHDSLLGWRNNGRPVINAPQNKDTLNSGGWRSRREFTSHRTKKHRIVLAGDSFSYGFMVDDSQTLDANLERDLGDDTEVYNMSVPAYGVDQMALVATRVAPDYDPDIIVVAFIAEDLNRSCSKFNFNLRKPYFVLGAAGAELRGVPVASPGEVLAEHNRRSTHLWDGIVATATRSRIIDLAGQVALQGAHNDCIEKLNPAIFRSICTGVKPGVRLVLAHLDGDLPPTVESQLRRMPAEYVSLPPIVRRLSKATGIPPERFNDRHPRPKLIQLYALALAEVLRSPRAPMR